MKKSWNIGFEKYPYSAAFEIEIIKREIKIEIKGIKIKDF